MFGLLLTLLILDGLLMIVVVLLQSGKGGGLAAMGGGGPSMGTDSLIGGRQAVTLLTKSTWVMGALFLVLALLLSIMSSRGGQAPDSVLQGEFQTTPAAPAQPEPILPGLGEGETGAQPTGEQPTGAGEGAADAGTAGQGAATGDAAGNESAQNQ